MGPKDKKKANIPNGCDLNIFSVQDKHWQPEGINDEDFVAVFTGTHGQANGLDKLLDAAKVLKQNSVTNIKIILIGQGKLKAQLKQQARNLKLDNVLFLDPVNKIKLAGLMKRADVGLQILANIPAFYYGTSPNKFFDYIASGLPVINNYPGWLAELIEKHQCGIAIPADNTQALVDALIELNNNRERLIKMSTNSLELAKSKFDRELLSEQFVNFIEASYQHHD